MTIQVDIRLALLLLDAAALAGCLAPDAVPGGESTGYDLAWEKSYGLDEDADKRALSVAATPEGGALLAGEFEGSLAISPLPELPNTDLHDGFVALFDEGGMPQWSVAFAGLGEQGVYRAVPAPGGGAVVAGVFSQTLLVDGADLGGTPEGSDGFVARLAQDGSLDWLVRVPGPGDQAVHSIALTGSGEVVLGGQFEGTLQVEGLATSETASGRDFFVAKLDPAGKPLWGVSLGGEPADLDRLSPVCLVATGEDGSIHVAGTFTGTVRLGGNLGAAGAQDVFVGKLDPAGKPLWGRAAGAPSSELLARGLAVGTAGSPVLAGDVRGEAQIDDAVTLASKGSEPDAFLAVYNNAGGLQWARRYGSSAEDHGGPVALDPEGNILFAGRFRGSISFAHDGALDNHDASWHDDIFLAALTPAGTPIASAAFGKDGNQVPSSVAAITGGGALLAGWFDGVVDFGGGDLDALFGDDMFVVRLAASGD